MKLPATTQSPLKRIRELKGQLASGSRGPASISVDAGRLHFAAERCHLLAGPPVDNATARGYTLEEERGGGPVDSDELVKRSQPFLRWAVDWFNGLPSLKLEGLIEEAGGPDRLAVLAVDVTRGFCEEGALASERVGAIVEPIGRLVERARALCVRHFLLPQDTHSSDAVEFGSFPPHCVEGTEESQTVGRLAGLPFSDQYRILEKDSISCSIGTGLDGWLDEHPEVVTFLVVGDCTDFCVYQLAMHLRLRANVRKQRDVRVIVPLDGVDTFDIPVEVAEEIGALPHPGDLFHLVFVFHMAQNGVEVVREVA